MANGLDRPLRLVRDIKSRDTASFTEVPRESGPLPLPLNDHQR